LSASILQALGLLLASAAAIYWACEYFVNGVEWVGRKAGVSQNAVGTVLAAFGTALPESVVTFVAVVFGRDSAARDIGVGAALGGPLVLATIAYPIVGIMLLLVTPKSAHRPLELDQRLSRDQGWFLLIFVCKIALGFVMFAIKPWLGWLFLLAYAAYTWTELRDASGHTEGDLEPLKLQPRKADPGLAISAAQTLLALVAIFGASHIFVLQLAVLGPWLGVPATVIALLVSPIATELPEIMNAIIWIKQGKQRLALGNISGAMMIQATVPTALGLFFTPWMFDSALALAGVVTALAIAGLLVLLRRGTLTPFGMSLFILLYAAFGVGIFVLWRSAHLA
jgi:cation:H+ antiporter